MLYTPLLPEAASGTLEPRHCVVPLRQMCPHADLILGSVTAFDLEAKTASVVTETGRRRSGGVSSCRARRHAAHAADSRPVGARPLVQDAGGRDQLRNHVLQRLEAADAALDEHERHGG